MNKKFIIRVTIIFIVLLLLYIFFSYYFSEKNKINTNDKVRETENILTKPNENIIKNIRYFSEDQSGDTYLIFADYGKINLANPDLTYMVNVTAIINFENSEKIQITSNFANFDRKSYETEFFEDVIIIRGDEMINSEKLRFSLEENLVVLSKDVVLNKPGFNLKADKVEIDLITKDSKITMSGKKKVIIIRENK